MFPVFIFSFVAFGQTPVFEEVSEKSLAVRKNNTLWISSFRGSITVTPSSADRFKVVLTKRLPAVQQDEAVKWFELIVLKVEERPEGLFVFPERLAGQDLSEKIRVRKSHPDWEASLHVFAPPYLKLKLSTSDGDISVKGWGNSVETSLQRGKVILKDIRGKVIAVAARSGVVRVDQIYSDDLKISLGQGEMDLENVESKSAWIEVLQTGWIKVRKWAGHFGFRLREGALLALEGEGVLRADIQKGNIEAHGLKGGFHLSSGSGNIWVEQDRSLTSDLMHEDWVELGEGHIKALISKDFFGCLEAWSVHGGVELHFPTRPWVEPERVGPDPYSLHRVCLGNGKGVLRVRNLKGNIEIFKKNN